MTNTKIHFQVYGLNIFVYHSTHEKNKNQPNCDQYMFVRRIAKWAWRKRLFM